MKRPAIAAIALAVAVGAPPAGAAPGPSDAPEYWFDSWRVDSLWGDGARGQGVTIAEIDTGVNATLPELRGRIVSGHDFGAHGNGEIDRDRDAFGHGTAMASIILGRPGPFDITGIAPRAKIMPLAVPLNDTTTAGHPDEVPRAIRYAADHHADIINMSLGGDRRPGVNSQPCDDNEQAAIFYALRKGALVVASVGNSGPVKNTVEDPGVCLGVLSVGAVDGSGAVARFSAREPYLTLVAPGVNVPSLGRVAGQAYAGAGTSQATALTSGVAALVWSAHPQLDARGVATRILATLDDHRSTPSASYGYGRLDAYRAVTAHVTSRAPNPVFDAVAPFMSRVDALNKEPPEPARAARGRIGAIGDYHVGSPPELTEQIVLGIVLAAFGLSLIVVLVTVGLDRRRQRGRAGAAAEPVAFGLTAPTPGSPPPSAPLG
ncbi:MAG TPA: S8 family serine peptidase [Jatrophihabitans sp.]|nr:S8 family serine peptidase [Jatrophihabitans sp.]